MVMLLLLLLLLLLVLKLLLSHGKGILLLHNRSTNWYRLSR
jgi:hypothetical protein